MRRFNPVPHLRAFFSRPEQTNLDKVLNAVMVAGLIAIGALIWNRLFESEAQSGDDANFANPVGFLPVAYLNQRFEDFGRTIRNVPVPAKPGALPQYGARSKWTVTVSACLTKTYFEATKSKLEALGFTVSEKSRLFGAIDEFSKDPARFAKRNEVIFPRLEDEEIAERIAYELNQLPALAKMEPKFAVDDADTPTVERELYVHIGGRSCPLTKAKD